MIKPVEAATALASPLDQYTEKFVPPTRVIEVDEKKGYIKFQHPLGSGATNEVREAFLAGDPNNPTAERYRTFDTEGKVYYGRILRGGEISLDIQTEAKVGITFGFNGWPAGPTLAAIYQSSELGYLSIGKPATSEELTRELVERKRYETSFNLFRFDGEWYFNFDNKGVSAQLINGQVRVTEETESLEKHKLSFGIEIKNTPESKFSYQAERKEDGSLTITGTDLTSNLKTTFEVKGNIDLEYWRDMLYRVEDQSWENCLRKLPAAFSALGKQRI